MLLKSFNSLLTRDNVVMHNRKFYSCLLATVLAFVAAAFALSRGAEVNGDRIQQARQIGEDLMASADIFDILLGATILAEMGQQEAYDSMVELSNSGDALTRRAAIDSLVSLHDGRSREVLLRLSGQENLLTLIVQALVSNPRVDMLELLQNVLHSEVDLKTKANAIRALVGLEDIKSVAKLRSLAENSSAGIARLYAIYGVAVMDDGHAFLGQLESLAHEGSEQEKELAAVTLGYINGDRSKQILATIKDSSEERVGTAALLSLVMLGDSTARGRLENLIVNGTRYESAIAAAGLRRVPSGISAEILTSLLECCTLKEDTAIRLIESSPFIAPSGVTDRVVEWGLAQSNTGIRLQSLWVIGKLRDRNLAQQAGHFLGDKDKDLRGMAAWMVARTYVDDIRLEG